MLIDNLRMLIREPVYRISLGLVLLSALIFLLAESLGVRPYSIEQTSQERLNSEKLQLHEIAQNLIKGDKDLHEAIKESLQGNSIVSSAAIFDADGELHSVFGEYRDITTKGADYELSISLPGWRSAGNLKVNFYKSSDSETAYELLKFLAFIIILGFVVYYLFLRRVMEGINPEDVIPDRVKIALDTLSEGLVILDSESRIVFANQSFSSVVSLPLENLLAKKCQDLSWDSPLTLANDEFPWVNTLSCGDEVRSFIVGYVNNANTKTTLSVNSSPVLGANAEILGALVTFDDISKIEKNNQELTRLIAELDKSQREINRQNKELKYLATRDSLTGVLNRRSLMQSLEESLLHAGEVRESVCCLMIDIDHFKSVNDNYGHLEGDNVIKLLANILVKQSRPNDLVGRYGGEEFILVLPGSNKESGLAIAERVRSSIEVSHLSKRDNHIAITASIGVSCWDPDVNQSVFNPASFIDKADVALYRAKQTGRNRVVFWSDELNHNSNSKDSSVKEDVVSSIDSLEYKVVNASKEADSEGFRQQLTSIGRTSETTVFLDRINQALKRSKRSEEINAIVVLNCDEIQYVHETMGISHAEDLSDNFLNRIGNLLRDTDTVAISDDERGNFSVSQISTNDVVVLLPGISDEASVNSIMHRLFVDFSRPELVNGLDVFLDCYAGISIAGVDGNNPEDLIRFASQAMLEAKRKKLNQRFLFFCKEIDTRCKRQSTLESGLYKAIDSGQLFLHYQPKIDLNSGHVYGLEALVRWRHPNLGVIPPGEFINLCERIGLIGELTSWVIRTVADDYHKWAALGLGVERIGINLSASEFHDQQLANRLIELLSELSLPCSAIEFEITETVLISNKYTAVCIMETLSEADIQITLDDFGVEYSSLSYIKYFPINNIKIDRSFIGDLNNDHSNAAIVKSMITLAKNLGFKVVAEGIETEEQLAYLHALSCDKGQGYFLSKPKPAEEISKILQEKVVFDSALLNYRSVDIIRPYKDNDQDTVSPLWR